eukprot:m.104836 g.104836  ORF g.104836 m.104836 type:complete len:95 (+) comp13264_c1_seq1:121-405(+)
MDRFHEWAASWMAPPPGQDDLPTGNTPDMSDKSLYERVHHYVGSIVAPAPSDSGPLPQQQQQTSYPSSYSYFECVSSPSPSVVCDHCCVESVKY